MAKGKIVSYTAEYEGHLQINGDQWICSCSSNVHDAITPPTKDCNNNNIKMNVG